MGPSGSGKSSLLYVLGALEPPSSGTITLDGQNPFQLSPDGLAAFRNRSVGFVFQDHCLLPQCTVLENVLVPTLVAEDDGGDAKRARDLVEQVGLSATASITGRASCRAASGSASPSHARWCARRGCCLCDEPTGNLDRASADQIAALLLDLHHRQRGILIVVTHSAQLAATVSDPLRAAGSAAAACLRSDRSHGCERALSFFAACRITGARTWRWCSAWRRRWRSSRARCSSATPCGAACAISSFSVWAGPIRSSVLRASFAKAWRRRSRRT